MTYLPALLAVGLILWRNRRPMPRRVRLGAMWIMPAILTLGAVAVLATTRLPPPLVFAAFAAAAAAGGAIGWLRARHMAFSVDRETGTVTSVATPVGTYLIIGLFVLRFGLKLIFPEMQGAGAAGPGHPVTQSALWWTDGGLLFAAGMIWGRAVTTWLRAKPLLDAHRAGEAAG